MSTHPSTAESASQPASRTSRQRRLQVREPQVTVLVGDEHADALRALTALMPEENSILPPESAVSVTMDQPRPEAA